MKTLLVLNRPAKLLLLGVSAGFVATVLYAQAPAPGAPTSAPPAATPQALPPTVIPVPGFESLPGAGGSPGALPSPGADSSLPGAAPVPLPSLASPTQRSIPRKPGAPGRAQLKRLKGETGPALGEPAEVAPLEAEVAAFDAQREEAANAVFRLGECYRRLKRYDEARLQYGRILREFLDFPELVKQSQKLLAQAQPPPPPRYVTLESTDRPEVIVSAGTGQLNLDSLKLRKAGAADLNVKLAKLPPATAESGEMAELRQKVGLQREELRRIELRLATLQNTSRPEVLPTRIIDDPRYSALKDKFEAAVLAAAGGEAEDVAAKKTLDQARKAISTWITELYLPELETAQKFEAEQLATIQKELSEEEKRLAERRAAAAQAKADGHVADPAIRGDGHRP